MPDKRIHQLIAERCDLQFNRRPHPLVSWRRRASWSCAVLAVGYLGFTAWQDDRSIYQARPVSLVHQQFQEDCSQCHGVPFQTIRQLWNDDTFVRDVEEAACLRCHDQAADDHHAGVLARQPFDCFACHREHAGEYGLARVEDSFCVSCHSDLRTDEGPSECFAATIASFADHPEFAVSRKPGDPYAAVGRSHLVRLVAEPAADGAGWKDRTTLRFPHDKHLDPAGVMIPASHPLAEGDRQRRKVLNCKSCHVTAEDGRYMKPVVYEQHCAECHPLVISKSLLGSIPHENPTLVQGVLRDRLAAYARQHPDEVLRRVEKTGSRLPNRRPPVPSARDIWEWIEDQLTKQPDKETLSLAKRVEWACAYCHTTAAAENGNRLLPFAIEPTGIPARWWRHASFRHDRHDVLIMDCTDCHAAAVSASAKDILLPGIENCQQCHVPASAATQGGARHDCVECHDYHARVAGSRRGPELWEATIPD